MKRFAVLFLCVTFLFVAGCGAEEDPAEERVGMEPVEEEPMEPMEPREPMDPAEPTEPAPAPEPAPEPEMEAEAVMLGDIDINTASSGQFQQLQGVGPATANNIIEYRNQHGSFSSVEELTNVSGIGPATLTNMKEAAGMDVETTSDADDAPAGEAININTASAAQLQQLHRVGAATAANIIAYREEHGDFASVDDLANVSGIGPATVDGLRDQATVE